MLFDQIQNKASFLCIGLDTDIKKIPSFLYKEKDPVFAFNKQIIDTTYPYAVAYKTNIAFYEVEGSKGWESLQKTIEYIPQEIFTIADAKRGDIGNTSAMYARTFFETFDFDSVTVSPYMGKDSILPFYEFKNKYVIILAATSNIGSLDFQHHKVNDAETLYENVIETSKKWGTQYNTMYVIGATRPEILQKTRKIIPEHFLLIPGIGVQGGKLSDVCKYGMNKKCGLLVNSSRSILYASDKKDFAQQARQQAYLLQQEMDSLLQSTIR